MKCRLTPNGSGWQLYIRKPVIKLLGYIPGETKVKFIIKDNCLHILPCNMEILSKNSSNYIRRLVKSGNGYGFYISNTVIELLDIDPESDYLKMTLDGNVMIVGKYKY